MQHFLTLSQIEERARALRISPRLLCQRAGVSESSWSRWMVTENGPLVSTLEKVQRGLFALEIEYLTHLIGLHPDKAREMLAATPPASPGGGVNTPSDAAAAGPLCGERAQMEDVA